MINTVPELIQELEFYEKALGILVGISISILAITKGLKFLWRAASDANAFAKELAEAIPEIKKIAKEFKPNGGKSLMDHLVRLENSIAHTNQKMKVMVSCLGLAAFETDNKGLYLSVSKQWLATTGLSDDQALGNGWINIIPEEDREEVFKEWTSSINQNREFHLKTEINSKEVSIIAWPIRNSDGSLEKFFGILI